MKKLSKITFRGIEYIRLSMLPKTEAESLRQALDRNAIIKILHNDIILNDCVLYYNYEKWYETYAANAKQSAIPELTPQATIA